MCGTSLNVVLSIYRVVLAGREPPVSLSLCYCSTLSCDPYERLREITTEQATVPSLRQGARGARGRGRAGVGCAVAGGLVLGARGWRGGAGARGERSRAGLPWRLKVRGRTRGCRVHGHARG
jgi:hypothetical protein